MALPANLSVAIDQHRTKRFVSLFQGLSSQGHAATQRTRSLEFMMGDFPRGFSRVMFLA